MIMLRRITGPMVLLGVLLLALPAYAVVSETSVTSGGEGLGGALIKFEDSGGNVVASGTTDAGGNVDIEVSDDRKGERLTAVVIVDGDEVKRQDFGVPEDDDDRFPLAIAVPVPTAGSSHGSTISLGLRATYGMADLSGDIESANLQRSASGDIDLDKWGFGPQLRWTGSPLNRGTGSFPLRPIVDLSFNWYPDAEETGVNGNIHPNVLDEISDSFITLEEKWSVGFMAGLEIARFDNAGLSLLAGARLTSLEAEGIVNEESGGGILNRFSDDETQTNFTTSLELSLPLSRRAGNLGNLGNTGDGGPELAFDVTATRLNDFDFSGSSDNFDYEFKAEGGWQFELGVGFRHRF